MKKKLLVLVLMLGLLLGGCAGFTNLLTGAQDKVCNAPASVIEVTDLVLNALKPVVANLVQGSAGLLAYVTAQGIKDTGCADITELNSMIAFIQGMNTAKVIMAKEMQAKGISTVPLQTWMASNRAIDVSPLVDWGMGKNVK